MVAYRFYYVSGRGDRHLVGTLPEKRHDPKRITYQSIVSYWNKVAGHIPIGKGHEICFQQVEVQYAELDEAGRLKPVLAENMIETLK